MTRRPSPRHRYRKLQQQSFDLGEGFAALRAACGRPRTPSAKRPTMSVLARPSSLAGASRTARTSGEPSPRYVGRIPPPKVDEHTCAAGAPAPRDEPMSGVAAPAPPLMLVAAGEERPLADSSPALGRRG